MHTLLKIDNIHTYLDIFEPSVILTIFSSGSEECVAAVTVKDSKDVFALLKGRERKVAPGEEPTFTWFKSGQEFDPEDRFKVLFKDEEDTLALVFQHVNPEDAGLYTCVASTSAGKIACSAELSVEGGVTQLLKVWMKMEGIKDQDCRNRPAQPAQLLLSF